MNRARLLISCPDRSGIVAAVARFLFEHGANIAQSDQHTTDPEGGQFFLRMEFDLPELDERMPELEREFSALGAQFAMHWRFAAASPRKRLAVFVSREPHCLLELLWQVRAGDLPADVAMVVGNHQALAGVAAAWDIPFHYVPVSAEHKSEAEAQQLALIEGQADVVVLARYMQILSGDFIARWQSRIINIHHSFLPAFAGANPYVQAYQRGVKLIGATAHYVTEDLDAGPIIEQGVERVDHRSRPDDLRRIGRYVERGVLARAVRWHVEDRILVHGNKTVVFA
ncbi:MAG TPA: formyltetrahydrofolate deformylase [Chloroflexota bacterium]|jgi:formyltetrahydrofolate deformylase